MSNIHKLYQFRFHAMGGEGEIRLYGRTQDEASAIAKKAIDEINRIENTYSRDLPHSLTSQINHLAGKTPVAITIEAFHLFEVADQWYQVSNGLFDITSGVLRHAWSFQPEVLPEQKVVQQYLQKVGWKKVEFNAGEIVLSEVGMELDLGSITKGYAVDRAAQILIEQGVLSGLVNLGGDIRILGPHIDGSPWPIQIAHPRIPGAILANISIAKGSLTTNGDYIRYIEIDGKRYCHILNPRTGHPVSWSQSVTVMAPLCLQAGQASTFGMLLESEALGFLEQTQLKFLLVDPNGGVIQNLA